MQNAQFHPFTSPLKQVIVDFTLIILNIAIILIWSSICPIPWIDCIMFAIHLLITLQVNYTHWMLFAECLQLLSDVIKFWPSNLSRSSCGCCRFLCIIPIHCLLEDETRKQLMTALLAIDNNQSKSIHTRTWCVAFSRVNYFITTFKNDKPSIRSINGNDRSNIKDASKHKYSPLCHCFLFLVFGLAYRKVIDCKIAYIASLSLTANLKWFICRQFL